MFLVVAQNRRRAKIAGSPRDVVGCPFPAGFLSQEAVRG